jgi:hypothetical protein
VARKSGFSANPRDYPAQSRRTFISVLRLPPYAASSTPEENAMVAVLLLLWSGSVPTYDDAAYRAAYVASKRPPDIQRRVQVIRFRGGDGGSHRFEPYHFEEAH